jgi:hypothetical protein
MDALLGSGVPRRAGEHRTDAMSKPVLTLLCRAWTFGARGKREAEGITIDLEGE